MFVVDQQMISIRTPRGAKVKISRMTAELLGIAPGDVVDDKLGRAVVNHERARDVMMAVFAKLNRERRVGRPVTRQEAKELQARLRPSRKGSQ